jgi:hypothetical protein
MDLVSKWLDLALDHRCIWIDMGEGALPLVSVFLYDPRALQIVAAIPVKLTAI